MARRGGMFKSEKRRKELKRKKKQDEKLNKRLKKTEGEDVPLDEFGQPIIETTVASEGSAEEQSSEDASTAEKTDEEAVSAEE